MASSVRVYEGVRVYESVYKLCECILSTYVHRTNTEAYGVRGSVCEERVWFVIVTLIN